MDFEQTSMMGTDTPMQGLQELGAFFARGSLRKVGEFFRVALPGNEGLQDGPTAFAQNIRQNAAEFQICVLKDLLNA